MENSNYLECSRQELANRTLQQNLANCATCNKVVICSYPRSITPRMVKEALNEESQSTENKQPQKTINLREIARKSLNFSQFVETTNYALANQEKYAKSNQDKSLSRLAWAKRNFNAHTEES
jgi:hypothetical protein